MEASLTAEGPAIKLTPVEMLKDGWATFKRDLDNLMTSPRDLAFLYICGFGTAFTYNTMANVMTVFATAEYGYGDVETGQIYGNWGLMSTLWAMALGPLIDKLGVRKSGVVGFTIYAIARFTICFIDDKDIFKFTVQWISPIAEGFAGLSSSLYGLGIKRYTTQANRNFAYAMYYAIYNMGGALAGFAIDAVSGYTWSPWGDPISGLRMALLMGLGTNTLCWVCAFALRPIKVEEEEDVAAAAAAAAEKAASDAIEKGKPVLKEEVLPDKSPIVILLEVSKDRNFWRYFALSMLLVLVKTEWHHNAATLPSYLIRQHGFGVPYASIASINWFMCGLLPPIVQSATADMNHLDVITYGCYLMGIAPFIMVLSNSVGAACLWNVVYTLGEVLWSPRTLTLAALIAPEGTEATFFSLAAAPQFMAKWPTGYFGGWLLDTFVPQCNECMDNKGHFCDLQPSDGSFYATPQGEMCLS